jgi:predicted nucleic acid-binding protein
VLSIVRRDHLLGHLDVTAARQAVEELRDWPGERFGHRALLERAWELRDTVRPWDALYVALAEALDGTLITLNARLGRPGAQAARSTSSRTEHEWSVNVARGRSRDHCGDP